LTRHTQHYPCLPVRQEEVQDCLTNRSRSFQMGAHAQRLLLKNLTRGAR
jgi:hypothetical protein